MKQQRILLGGPTMRSHIKPDVQELVDRLVSLPANERIVALSHIINTYHQGIVSDVFEGHHLIDLNVLAENGTDKKIEGGGDSDNRASKTTRASRSTSVDRPAPDKAVLSSQRQQKAEGIEQAQFSPNEAEGQFVGDPELAHLIG